MSDFFRNANGFAQMMREALRELTQHEPLQIAGATSFFAVFALPPILIVLTAIFGIFGSNWVIMQDLLQELSLAVDKNTINEVGRTATKVRWLPLGFFMHAAGFLFLLFVATTFFSVVRGSLDQLWNVRPKKNIGFLFMLAQRAKSLGAILLAGALALIPLDAVAKIPLMAGHLILQGLILKATAMLASIVWFVFVFRFLANGRPSWKASIAGGAFAGLLFTIGKSVLRLLLSYNKVHTIYGASAAMVLLLLFVFYSSLIFYYSACFVKVVSDRKNMPILPTRYAIKYVLRRT